MSTKEKNSSKTSDKFHVGIDAGSVSLNCAVINQRKEIVYEAPYRRHMGKVEEGAVALMDELYKRTVCNNTS